MSFSLSPLTQDLARNSGLILSLDGSLDFEPQISGLVDARSVIFQRQTHRASPCDAGNTPNTSGVMESLNESWSYNLMRAMKKHEQTELNSKVTTRACAFSNWRHIDAVVISEISLQKFVMDSTFVGAIDSATDTRRFRSRQREILTHTPAEHIFSGDGTYEERTSLRTLGPCEGYLSGLTPSGAPVRAWTAARQRSNSSLWLSPQE